MRIFNVKLQYLKKTRGELKLEIRRSLRNIYRGDIKIQLLEDFGNDVSSDFNIQPFGGNSHSRLKNTTNQYDWKMIHPVIVKHAKPRYESSHFADAVEAAYKELNEMIKKEYVKINQSELDGAKLMRTVFSLNNPVFKLLNMVSESERNIQEGYMNIFAGVMIGIRNPKAHSNIEIDQQDAWEKIVIASHLMKMWDNRIKEDEKTS